MALWTTPKTRKSTVKLPSITAPTVTAQTPPAGDVMAVGFQPQTAVNTVAQQAPNRTTTTVSIPGQTSVSIPPVAAQIPQPTSDPLVFDQNKPATVKPSLFSGTTPGVGTNYANTLNAALTGQIYDPMAAGAKEAQARGAANARASTAGQIAKAGFAGTGIGQSIAGGTENQLTKQKYDTMIGIEQARNEGRVGALGEARAYGTAEEGIRQYEQNFGQDKMVDERNFNEDVRRYGQDFAEKKRQYDQDFAEDKSRYGDTQNSQAYQAALVNGSDADVIAAYKAWTGKDLDPAAVSTYRGYARTAAEQGLKQGAADLNAGVGKDFAAYVTNHPDLTPDSIASDPALRNSLQKLWESNGQTGPFDPTWGAAQVKAVKDSGNTFIMFGKAIDDAVAFGSIPADVGETMKNVGNNTAFWSAFDRDANGNAVPNLARMETALGLPAGSLGGTSTTTTTIPEDIWGGSETNTIMSSGDSPEKTAILEARGKELVDMAPSELTKTYAANEGDFSIDSPMMKTFFNEIGIDINNIDSLPKLDDSGAPDRIARTNNGNYSIRKRVVNGKTILSIHKLS